MWRLLALAALLLARCEGSLRLQLPVLVSRSSAGDDCPGPRCRATYPQEKTRISAGDKPLSWNKSSRTDDDSRTQIRAPPPWRNDSQNLELAATWQEYLAGTLLSDEFGGSNITDAQPLRLEWSLLGDMPFPWKDGVACWFAGTGEVVLAGGLWQVWSGVYDHALNTSMIFRPADGSWSSGAQPPYLVGRTQGACSATAMFIVGGSPASLFPASGPPANRYLGRRVIRLHSEGFRGWEMLPELPAEGQRWAGASAHLGDKWLLVGMGVPAAGPGTAIYRLRVGSTGPASGTWETVPPLPVQTRPASRFFPLWIPISAVVGNSWYVFGGQFVGRSAAAWERFATDSNSADMQMLFEAGAKPSGAFVDSRESFRYDADTNSWATLPSMPIGMIQGPKLAPVFADGRFILLLGSQERVTFRIGRNHAPTSVTETHVTYGGDDIIYYDIDQGKFGRAGKMLYGVSTLSAVSNATHIIAFGGEPSHGWSANTESAIQVARVNFSKTDNTASSPAQARETAWTRDVLRAWSLTGSCNSQALRGNCGVAAGVVDLQQQTRTMEFVYAGNAQKSPPANWEHLMWEIGSNTKTFTATLLQLAVDKGTISLDQQIWTLLPPSMEFADARIPNITMRQLGSHSSGLVRMPDNLHAINSSTRFNPWFGYTTADALDFLSRTKLGAWGKTYLYSNYAFGLLGLLLERAHGIPYTQLCTEKIFQPLGMSRTAIVDKISMSSDQWNESVAVGVCSGKDSGCAAGTVAERDLPLSTAVSESNGAYHSSITDMLAFVEPHLRSPRADELAATQQLAFAMARMTQPVAVNGAPPNLHGSVALAWEQFRSNLDTVHWKDGGTAGYDSKILYDRRRQRAAVLLSGCGGCGGGSYDPAARLLLDGPPDVAEHVPPGVGPSLTQSDGSALASFAGCYRFERLLCGWLFADFRGSPGCEAGVARGNLTAEISVPADADGALQMAIGNRNYRLREDRQAPSRSYPSHPTAFTVEDFAPPREAGLAALNASMRVFGIVSRASPAVVDELVWHVSGWDMVAARCACPTLVDPTAA